MVLKDGKSYALILGIILIVLGILIGFITFSRSITIAVVGAALAIAGIAIIFLNEMITITLDKASGKMLISHQRVLNSRSEQTAISDIKQVVVRKDFEQNYSSGRRGGYDRTHDYTTYYRLVFALGTGKELVFRLGSVKTTVSEDVTDVETKALAQKVADFLGVPLRFPDHAQTA